MEKKTDHDDYANYVQKEKHYSTPNNPNRNKPNGIAHTKRRMTKKMGENRQ